MSTSLLVAKMEQSAKSRGIDCKIWAIAASEVSNEIENADVVLLGPQVRFLLPQVKKAGEQKGIPVATINPQDYGLCNGEKVLEHATTLIKGE